MEKKYGFTAKSAFTLAEILIALVVLGVAIALTVPSILQQKPNESMAKFKKAYSTAEKVITELAYNETLYSGIDAAGNSTVFADIANVNANGIQAGGNTKFCTLFASQINTIGRTECVNPTEFQELAENANPSFSTADGIQWVIRPMALQPGTRATDGATRNGVIEIQVDVNQGQRSGNTYFGLNPDRFRIWVDFDGKMTVPLLDASTGNFNLNAADRTIAVQYLRQTSPGYRCARIVNNACVRQ